MPESHVDVLCDMTISTLKGPLFYNFLAKNLKRNKQGQLFLLLSFIQFYMILETTKGRKVPFWLFQHYVTF